MTNQSPNLCAFPVSFTLLYTAFNNNMIQYFLNKLTLALFSIVLLFGNTTNVFAWDFCWPSCSTAMPMDDRTMIITGTGRGIIFSGEAVPELMERAARETLARGYTYFILQNADSQTDYIPNFGRYGGYNQVGNARAVVRMMTTEEGRATGAINARKALAKYIDE